MKPFMKEFVELLRESVIFQGMITVIVLTTTAILIVQGRPLPQELWLLDGAVVGFFFGGKYTQSVARAKQKDC